MFFNEKLYLHQKGVKTDENMVDTLNGYVLASLDEIPKEISFIKNNPAIRKEGTEKLEKELLVMKDIKKEIVSFLS